MASISSPAADHFEDSSDDDCELDMSDWTEAEKKELKKAVENKEKKMSILCCGPTGVGKSTLLNGLLGEELLDANESLSRVTLNVSEKKFEKNGVQVTVWDTPGLGGCDNDEEYFEEIRKYKDFDIFLYCIEAREKEVFYEKSSLAKFTDTLGVNLWEQAVVVLTQANCIEANLVEEKKKNDSIDVSESFRTKVYQLKTRVREDLKELTNLDSVRVPVLPAGINNNPLNGDSNWLEKIHNKMVNQMQLNSRIAYLQLCIDQPFSLSLRQKIEAGAFAAGALAAGGAAGAATGAVIGALLIGIPSFGVFAGVGLVVGGLIGGGTGVASAGVVAAGIRTYKKKKDEKRKKKLRSLANIHKVHKKPSEKDKERNYLKYYESKPIKIIATHEPRTRQVRSTCYNPPEAP